MSYAHSFEDIYFEYRQLNITVNFSFIYEEWKLRNHIHLPSVAPTPVSVRHAPRYGSIECCSVWDGSGILPTIFAVWWASQWLIWYFYGPPLSGRRDPLWEDLREWWEAFLEDVEDFRDWWRKTMAGEGGAQEGGLGLERQRERPDATLEFWR